MSEIRLTISLGVLIACMVVSAFAASHARAAEPKDYFLPPEGRAIELKPRDWQEKLLRDQALAGEPPNCGGSCHQPRGLPEDEPFLRAAARYATALSDFRESQRRLDDWVLKQLAEGTTGRELSEGRARQTHRLASELSLEQGSYRAAMRAYLDRLRQRGIGAARVQYLEREHGLWTQ